MEIDSCRRELSRLQKEQIAYQAQMRLLENFVAMAQSSGEAAMLKAAMQKSLNIAVDLTQACCGSLFLFDENEAVTDSILARNALSESERSRLVGEVLNEGLAGWTRRHRKVGIVDDTSSDARWITLTDQPYQTRSALAVPIMRGEKLFGILTLMHPEPAHFRDHNIDVIQMTADQMALVLENIRLYQELGASYKALEKAKASVESYSAALDRELENGRRIQQDFLPGALLDVPGWNIRSHFAPAQRVAGDFYDVFRLPGNKIGWVVGDVCDKGVGAALYMGLFRSLIRLFSGQTELNGVIIEVKDRMPRTDPASEMTPDAEFLCPLRAVNLTNGYVVQNHGRMGIFATLFFGVVDPASGAMAYINAGHEAAYVVGLDGIKTTLGVSGPSVGLSADSRFEPRWVQLAHGDILIGHTDGVTEAFSARKGFFGRSRLQEVLGGGAATVAGLVERLQDRLNAFCAGGPQSDDITLLAIQRLVSSG